MKTIKKIMTFNKINQFIILKNGILYPKIKNENKELIKIENCIKKPKLCKIFGNFLEIKKDYQIKDNNILGNSDYFIINNNNEIKIPIEEYEQHYLSYYNAVLINDNDIFCLNNKDSISMYEIEIGEQYVKYYLLQPYYGNGFYIEFHDLPHFHQPINIDSSGYIILAKQNQNFFELTAFKIPFTKALFIPPYVYHSDAFLVGNYNIIYGKTEIYKTFVFKNSDHSIRDIQIT